MIFNKLKRFILTNYVTLYYFQEIIDEFKIYYDRKKFLRLHQNLSKYCLYNYRSLHYQDYQILRKPDYPIKVNKNIRHLRVLKYFSFFYMMRCFCICYFKPVANTQIKRIYLGTEMFKNDSYYLETSFLFWSTISFLYLQFALTPHTLDYKFLAIFHMSVNDLDYLPPSKFGLSIEEFKKFDHVRKAAKWYYHYGIMAVFPVFGPICCSFLYIQADLYSNHLLPSIFWTIILDFWVYVAVNTIVSNLIAFIVVSKYVHIKQKSICVKIEKCLLQFKSNYVFKHNSKIWNKFIKLNKKFSHFQDELSDYNYFWTTYISIVFVFYVMIISFTIYISIFSGIALYVKIIYAAALAAHIILLGAIIYYAGGVVKRNENIAKKLSFITTHFVRYSNPFLDTFNLIKLHNICMNIKAISLSGFNLLNGYLITYDTYRLLIVNITIYFILVL